MNTNEVAQKLVNFCRKGQYTEAQDELYSKDIVSIEPKGTPTERAEGIAAIKAKAEQWSSMVEEVHSNVISDPVIAGNFFSIAMKTEATFKGMGRQTMEEVCVYEVKNGKVVTEQFFFTPAPM
ncbi:nuclear transport factor 2 family protein [Flexithrix dorotheae]|uniref:nuclear transport factor 2 family protein n=1 Tax=Flexithrix dorotheae TaxID=70993 RepID=UPI0003738C1B|nr:nuclear transport factor 2 family protein [Flexithrix dorotheae]